MRAESIAHENCRYPSIAKHTKGPALLLSALALWIALQPAVSLASAGPFQKVGPVEEPPCQLRAVYHNSGTRVLPPEQVLDKVRPKTATFIVTYNGFSPQAQAAFQHAVDIWEQLITSAVPIRVQANWTPLDPGVLGGAGANLYWTNGTNVFPDALADALNGSDLGGGGFDIIANFNSDLSGGFSWYLGTDANPGANQFDFASVVLHELSHGLGFAGLMTVVGGMGFRIFDDPAIYASFTEDLAGVSLFDEMTYPDGSTQLAGVLQSGNVFFNGPMAVSTNSGTRPELYAPAIWESGSSFSHLDENVFPPGDPDSLMTPFLSLDEAIHNPGDITLCMFQDMGWTTSSNCMSSGTTSLSALAGLIVPGFEVEVDNATGPTTFFAIRNTSDISVDATVAYHAEEVTDTPLRTDNLTLGPQQTATVNVRSNLTDLPVSDGFATGLILINQTSKEAPSLEGDFFRLDQANAFATGDRLVRPSEFCMIQEMRFVEFGSGSEFRILVDTPQGQTQRSFSYTAYDQQGNVLVTGGYFTSEHLTTIDVTELGFNDSFGTVVFDFTNSGGGWVSAKYSAFGLFSVELNSTCRDTF